MRDLNTKNGDARADSDRELDLVSVKQEYDKLVEQIEKVKSAFSNFWRLDEILKDIFADCSQYTTRKISLNSFKEQAKDDLNYVIDEIIAATPNLADDQRKKLLILVDNLQKSIAVAPKNPQRLRQLEKVYDHMEKLKEKSKQFERDKQTRAQCTVDTLISILDNFTTLYINNRLTLDKFQKISTRVIDNSHQVLDRHRGCKEFLHNLAYFIKTLGIGYAISAIKTGSFYPKKPNTDSKDKLDKLQSDLNGLQCNLL